MSSTSTQSSTASFSSDTADFYCNNNCVIGKVNLSFTKIGKDSYQKSKPTFIENWKNLTSRPTAINNDNFFVCTGKVSEITIIDVDRKNNKDGFAELKRVGIEMKDYRNICASIKTPSGMRHYVFKYDERLATGANVYGLEGVDIRNDDGVVFAGKHYRMLSIPEQLGRIPDDLYNKLCNRMNGESNTKSKKCKNDKDLCAKYLDIIDEDNIDDKYYELCNLLEDKWFNDFDKWVKIGYALYNESSVDKDVALNTWLKLLEDRSDKFNQIECLRIWDRQSEDGKCKVSMGTIVNSVSQTNKEAYEQWRKQYYKHKGKSFEKVYTLEDEFESTFDSARNTAEVENMLIQMNKTFEDFKLAMCDESFERFTEISHWCKDYCVITNSVDHTFNNDFRIFENMLKTLKFNSREIALRFIAYFIHEFYIFLTTNNRLCYTKSKSINDNTSVLKEYDITAFKSISVHYVHYEHEEKLKKTTLSDLLTQLPIHKFDNTVCKWNHDSSNLSTFSIVVPFKVQLYDRDVSEEDILPNWLYYMKSILCDNDNKKWEWLRAYLANIIHQPDKRTEVMLLLYSPEKRLGKSTLFYWLENYVFGSSNICKVDNMSNAFGERGGPQMVGKKLVWLEELSESKKTFRTCMDRVKTAITDSTLTYRKLYHEVQQIENTNEFIAATNHLVGVLEDRFTVLKVNPERKDDRCFYGKLRSDMIGEETNKFITYLKRFTTSMPMPIHKTKEYESMLSNASESIVQYLSDLKESFDDVHFTNKCDKHYHISKSVLFDHYSQWCSRNNEKPLTFLKFKDKLIHYDSTILYKKMKLNDAPVWGFEFPFEGFFETNHTE